MGTKYIAKVIADFVVRLPVELPAEKYKESHGETVISIPDDDLEDAIADSIYERTSAPWPVAKEIASYLIDFYEKREIVEFETYQER